MKRENDIGNSERRLAAILFSDVVGYTAMMQDNEEHGRRTLMQFRETTQRSVPEWKGKIVQFYGDGCLILFDSAANALQCAKDLQFVFRNDHDIPVRMGLHMGDIFIAEDHVYGDSINIAARIESMGIAGSILFSEAFHDNIKNQREFLTSPLGSYQFKNIKEPIPVFALSNDGLVVPDPEETVQKNLGALQILVIEDEPLAADRIIKMIKSINAEHHILATLDTVSGAIDWLGQHRMPDVILSDIQLADGLSLKIYSTVTVSCPIIFTTAFEKYAVQAFEVNGVDYLLKPIQEDRLRQALEKCASETPEINTETQKLLEEFKELLNTKKAYKSRFLCKLGTKIKSIPVEKILYFFSKNKITFIVDQNGNRLPANHTLDEVEQLVDPESFFRVNRQFVVHFDAIQEIQPYFKGRLKVKLDPDPEEDITISSEKSPLFKAWLDR